MPTVPGAIVPSATVNPALVKQTPILGGNGGSTDEQNFTPGALPTIDNPNASATITPTPLPTASSISLYIQSGSLTLVGRYYGALRKPGIAALLLPDGGELKEGWRDLPALLQNAGFSALAIDLRGYGETGGVADWNQAPLDTATTLTYMHTLPTIDSTRSIVIGSGVGAALAFTICLADSTCQAVVLISPQANAQGLTIQPTPAKLGKRAVLIIAASDNPYFADAEAINTAIVGPTHTFSHYTGTAQGQALLAAHPEATGAIVDWLTQLALSTKK